jgi:hypothetical protein
VAAAQRRKGELLGGEDGRMLSARADATFREQSVEYPRAFLRLLAPGF